MLTTVMFLLATLGTAPKANTHGDPRWKIDIATVQGQVQDIDIGPDCHALGYFSDTKNLKRLNYLGAMIGPRAPGLTYSSVARSHRVGEIGGFAIYEVIFQVNEEFLFEVQPYAIMKMILVERKPGEFCQIFNEQGKPRDVDADGSAAIVGNLSEPVLAAGKNAGEYWTFDKDGPVLLDMERVFETVRADLPPGRFLPLSGSIYAGFDIAALSYSVALRQRKDQSCCPTGGTITIRFALENHRLVVIERKYESPPPP